MKGISTMFWIHPTGRAHTSSKLHRCSSLHITWLKLFPQLTSHSLAVLFNFLSPLESLLTICFWILFSVSTLLSTHSLAPHCNSSIHLQTKIGLISKIPDPISGTLISIWCALPIVQGQYTWSGAPSNLFVDVEITVRSCYQLAMMCARRPTRNAALVSAVAHKSAHSSNEDTLPLPRNQSLLLTTR